MEHSYIDDHNVADRYILGTLTPEERAGFEEHFVDCAECLDRIQDAERWRSGLKTAIAQGPRARSARWGLTALLAAAFVVCAVVPVALWRELGRARADIARAQASSSEWQRRYAESVQARSALPAIPKTLPVFPFTLMRGAQGEPATPPEHIAIPAAAPWVVFSLEQADDPNFLSYRATVSTAPDRVVWTASDLKRSTQGGLALTVPSRFLQPGDYALVIEGATRRGQFVRVGRYPFRIEK